MSSPLEHDRWSDIDALFEQALAQPPAKRTAFVLEACGEDEELLNAVTELLAVSAEAADFLEDSGSLMLSDTPLSELAAALVDESSLAGAYIGPYRVVRCLARGGMGTVYLAERADGQFEQQVALKVLRRGLDTEDVLRRFRAERQILASLKHQHIARLLDGGETPDGRPYLIMEYVNGRPIDSYADDERLTLEDRVRLFRQVGLAVQSAHRSLVVHRDLKPTNIIVSEEGAVKLLDFGIAKLLGEATDAEGALRTRTGVWMMTPQYASPEQIRGEPITTASDIYQLGLLLYELLSGQRAYELQERSPTAVERAVCTTPPPLMSSRIEGSGDGVRDGKVAQKRRTTPERLRRRLRGDLDAIAAMALRKDPEDRYISVEQMLEDLERFFDGRPVRARRGSHIYRARKFLRRNAAAVSAAAVVLLLVAVYLATLTIYTTRLEQERATARIEERKAKQISEYLVGLFEHADPSVARGEAVTARALLDQGNARIRRELTDQPEVRATMLSTMARVYESLGITAQARNLAEEALELRRSLMGPDHPEIAESLLQLARVTSRTDRDSARILYRAALEEAERVHGPDHPFVARILTTFGTYGGLEPGPKNDTHDRALRILYSHGDEVREQLADALVFSTHGNETLPLDSLLERQRTALGIYREIHGEKHPRIAETLSDMALTLQYTDPVATDSLLRRAVVINRETMGATHPTTLTLMNNHAGVLRGTDELKEAEEIYREVLRTRRRVHPRDRVNLAYSLYGLGRVLIERGELNEAEALLREAFDVFPAGDSRWVLICDAIAEILQRQDRLADAEDLLLPAWRQVQGDESEPALLRMLIDLYRNWERADEAAKFEARLPQASGSASE